MVKKWLILSLLCSLPIVSLLAYHQWFMTRTTLWNELKTDEAATTSEVLVHSQVDGNTQLSSNWASATLTFTKQGVTTSKVQVEVKTPEVQLSLPNGVYTVKAESKDAKVELSHTKITILGGKANVALTFRPLHVLEVTAEGMNDNFSVINVPSLQNQSFTGRANNRFGVMVGESYVIRNNKTNAVFTVAIDERSKRTVVSLNKGVLSATKAENQQSNRSDSHVKSNNFYPTDVVHFDDHVTDMKDTATTLQPTSSASRDAYWETVKADAFQIYPEVMMFYDDVRGNPSAIFVAGDHRRQIQPLVYNTISFGIDEDTIDVNVTSDSIATDARAKNLARQLSDPAQVVIYKGSSVEGSLDVAGVVSVKTYALDVNSTEIGTTSNIHHDTKAYRDAFLATYANQDEQGRWTLPMNVSGGLKIDDHVYLDKGSSSKVVPATMTSVTDHRLVVRGGVLTQVDGIAIDNIGGDLKDALTKMGICTERGHNIFAAFQSSQGDVLAERALVTLGNAVRGVSTMATNKGWYNEDTTVLVVREYMTVFKTPKYTFASHIPITIAGLETPIDQSHYFNIGAKGYVRTTLTLPSAKGSLSYTVTSKTPNYIVPNVSIADMGATTLDE